MIFVTGYVGEGAARMFYDLKECGQVSLIEKVIENRIKRFLFFRIHEWTKEFRHCKGLKRLLENWYTVFRCHAGAGDCFLFINSLFCTLYDSEMLKKLKRKFPKAKMVLYIVDPMKGFSEKDNLTVISMMDEVYSAHESDCRKYGFQYQPLVYSFIEPLKMESGEEHDLYYLGSGRDRTAFLTRIALRCKESGIRADFHVVGKKTGESGEGIHFHAQRMPYEENAQRIANAKCILEIMHDGFQGITQRYVEAVCYNKKFLTNNASVTEQKYYDPRFMKVFREPEDIDLSFLLEEAEADYGYQGDFSPTELIKRVQKRNCTKI